MNKTCPNCGFYPNLADASFCHFCGKTLDVRLCEFDAAPVLADDEYDELFAELGVGD